MPQSALYQRGSPQKYGQAVHVCWSPNKVSNNSMLPDCEILKGFMLSVRPQKNQRNPKNVVINQQLPSVFDNSAINNGIRPGWLQKYGTTTSMHLGSQRQSRWQLFNMHGRPTAPAIGQSILFIIFRSTNRRPHSPLCHTINMAKRYIFCFRCKSSR